jgi:hypothetical protein
MNILTVPSTVLNAPHYFIFTKTLATLAYVRFPFVHSGRIALKEEEVNVKFSNPESHAAAWAK